MQQQKVTKKNSGKTGDARKKLLVLDRGDNRRERCIRAFLKFEIKFKPKDAALRSRAQTDDEIS